ncbi:MAG TPA: ABC transporter permease, partial [Desulfobacterales bacterium]|nr:ABC transporter permease [Desulfobacterales bacterium]
MKKRSGTFYLLMVPVLLWLVVLIVIPHLDMFFRSFRFENDDGLMVFSLNNYLSFFEDKIYWLTFVQTALYSIGVTFLAFVVTFPVAFYLTKV